MNTSNAVPQSLQPEALLRELALSAQDKKGQRIIALDVRELVYYADYFLICSSRSERQVTAVSEEIARKATALEVKPIGIEGLDHSRWVLMDYGSIMVHVFVEELRDLYELEKLWADAPIVDLDLPDIAQAPDDDDDDDLSWDFE